MTVQVLSPAPVWARESKVNTEGPGLLALRQRLHQDLQRLGLPADDWLNRPAGDPTLDVAIVGGGMSGLAAAAALRLLGVHKVRVFDRNPAGAAGPWVTHARMETLRSPKQLSGPALGLPSLTFRAWYEAQFGAAGWEQLDRIPRAHWQDYLNWYSEVLDLPVTHQTQIEGITETTLPDGQHGVGLTIRKATADKGQPRYLQARHLVLATGMDGLGGAAIPAEAALLPRARWQHTSEHIDFEVLRGRRLGIVGGGDSGLDAAATALEAGAAEVQVFVRSADFTRINYWKAFAHPGHYHGFNALTPEARQPLLDFLKAQKVPPARGTVRRLARFDNVRLHFNSPVTTLSVTGDQSITVSTPHDDYSVDHLVFATGYATKLSARPELQGLAPHIRFWNERDAAPVSSFALNGFPDLAADFSLREKTPGACPVLSRVHLFTGAALMSVGKLTGDIPGISHGAERLARGIAARLYADDLPHQFQTLRDYDELEVQGDEWAAIRINHPAPRHQQSHTSEA